MTDRLPTGIATLDRKLNDGVPPGSVVVLSASPASQSEQFLHDLTRARRTVIVTTRRPRESVQRSVYRASPRPENVTVCELDGASPLEETYTLAEGIDDPVNLIIDPLDPLERDRESRYVSFLNALRDRAIDTDSLVFLHCLDGRSVPDNRDITEYIADVVFELSTEVSGDAIENRLAVPKFRDGEPFKEPLKLELAGKVTIDTSRDIG